MNRLEQIIAKLWEASAVLAEAAGDMEVTEWNSTPDGIASGIIGEAIELIREIESEVAS